MQHGWLGSEMSTDREPAHCVRHVGPIARDGHALGLGRGIDGSDEEEVGWIGDVDDGEAAERSAR